VLAGQVELKTFTARQRIYKAGDPGGGLCRRVRRRRVTTVDEDGQEVVVASPLRRVLRLRFHVRGHPHQTNASP